MGSILEEWVFFGERKEDGHTIRYAKNQLNMKIYRFEPVVAKFPAGEAGKFRAGIQARNQVIECLETINSGILRVCGPDFFSGKFWIGWQSRRGESFFRSFESQPSLDLVRTLTGLYPLIQAYRNFNRAGFIVGRPDWRRLYRDANGVYMVDPLCLPYLTAPFVKLPLGLENCRPPETYGGSELNESGDLFYLGLIIYLALTNRLPFEMMHGWPTKALFKGEIISPVIFQTSLHPFLAEQIKFLLHPNPEKRGVIQQLEAFWRQMLDEKSFLAPVTAQIFIKKEQQKFQRKIRWQKIRCPVWGTAAGLIFLALFIFLISFQMNRKSDQETAPIIAVQKLYQIEAGPPQAGMNLQAHSFMMRDYAKERQQRLEAAKELLMRPLAEVKGTQLIRRTLKQAIVEVSVCRWEWRSQKWRNRLYKERLTLNYQGKKWSAIARKIYRNELDSARKDHGNQQPYSHDKGSQKPDFGNGKVTE